MLPQLTWSTSLWQSHTAVNLTQFQNLQEVLFLQLVVVRMKVTYAVRTSQALVSLPSTISAVIVMKRSAKVNASLRMITAAMHLSSTVNSKVVNAQNIVAATPTLRNNAVKRQELAFPAHSSAATSMKRNAMESALIRMTTVVLKISLGVNTQASAKNTAAHLQLYGVTGLENVKSTAVQLVLTTAHMTGSVLLIHDPAALMRTPTVCILIHAPTNVADTITKSMIYGAKSRISALMSVTVVQKDQQHANVSQVLIFLI